MQGAGQVQSRAGPRGWRRARGGEGGSLRQPRQILPGQDSLMAMAVTGTPLVAKTRSSPARSGREGGAARAASAAAFPAKSV